jgi:putative transposase
VASCRCATRTTSLSGPPVPFNPRTILEQKRPAVYCQTMTTNRPTDQDRYASFVTFSCYHRRRLLDHDRAKKIVLGVLRSELARQSGRCVGFVVMPNHVHAILWFPNSDQMAQFMKQWKQRSSVQIKKLFQSLLVKYTETFDEGEPVWQAGYYEFPLYSEVKTEEKLVYMHQNPVKAGLAALPCDWPWSSARHYEHGRSVGVPLGWLV